MITPATSQSVFNAPHHPAGEHLQLKETISNISHSCEGYHANLGTVTDSIEMRDFGILLLLPALIVLLPISLIPGISPLCAAVILFTRLHIFFGREELWLPKRIRRISFNGSMMIGILGKIKPVAKTIDRFSKPRLAFMTNGFCGKTCFWHSYYPGKRHDLLRIYTFRRHDIDAARRLFWPWQLHP